MSSIDEFVDFMVQNPTARLMAGPETTQQSLRAFPDLRIHVADYVPEGTLYAVSPDVWNARFSPVPELVLTQARRAAKIINLECPMAVKGE